MITLEDFRNKYWYKKDLVAFCREHCLPTQGGKEELALRIESFLETGEIKLPKIISRKGPWDSESEITRETFVVNYRNDSKTRVFFEKEIGRKFKFNSYLRDFAKQNNEDLGLTYGDLVQGWIEEENRKKDPNYKSSIGKQFEFNQFQRDYYACEKGKAQKDCIEAWRTILSTSMPKNYNSYLEFISKKE